MIWVAEIGSCHQGDKSLAYELIRKAKRAGATIAKFQFGWTREAQEKYAGGYDERRYVDDWAKDLAKWCADMDIELMASIWSLEGLEVARSVGMKRYKIAHQMRDNRIYDQIMIDPADVFVSEADHGEMWNWSEKTGFFRILCNTEYPSYQFKYNSDAFGYSSHVHGIADALIAVARGAEYIEKHVVISQYAGFPKDASFAITPEEFRTMVDIGNEMARLR